MDDEGEFYRYLAMSRRVRTEEYDDGFDFLLANAGRFVELLLREYSAETDSGLRYYLLWFLSESRSPKALPVFATELLNDEPGWREKAERGLELLGTREARQLLWQHRSNMDGFTHPPYG